jgi:hypothetical protein
MPTVRFSKRFRWTERNGQSDRDYAAGETYKGVRRAIADAAVKAGAGEVVGEADAPAEAEAAEQPAA